MSQLVLPLGSNPRHTFENFCGGATPASTALEETLERGGSLWLCGPADSGKTHLLQAVCHRARLENRLAAYVPLDRMQELEPAVLTGLERCAWVCLDDIDRVLQHRDWERHLFVLLNQAQAHGASMVLASRRPAAECAAELPDLRSRLRGAVACALQPLAEGLQLEALQRRARSQGYDLPEDVVRYLQRYAVRGLGALCRQLDALEELSLRQKRRITLPFVREALGGASALSA